MKVQLVFALMAVLSTQGFGRSSGTPQTDVADLRDRASQITKQIGALAADGTLPTSDEGIALLKQLVGQLEEINARLKRLESQLAATPSPPKPKTALDRFTPTLSVQFQFRDSNRQTASAVSSPGYFGVPYAGNREHSMSLRRVRFGANYEVDPQTLIRIGIEGANGTSTDQFQLREARIVKSLDPATKLSLGQFPLPFGYENWRSSTDREFPEFAQYNRLLNAGEAYRGAMIQHTLSTTIAISGGVFGSLAINDPEQSGRGNMPQGRAAGFASIRYATKGMDFGFSALVGHRPAFKTTGTPGTAMADSVVVVTPGVPVDAPDISRQLYAIDATIPNLLTPGLTLRSEIIWGRDRLPIAATTNSAGAADGPRSKGRSLFGWQAQLSWALNSNWSVFSRMEFFDADSSQSGDSVTGFGLGVRQKLGSNELLTLTYERFRVPQFSVRRMNDVLTLRYQIRF